MQGIPRRAEREAVALHGSRKARRIPLGSVSFKLLAGQAKTVVMKLPGPAAALLKAKGSLAAGFTLTLTGQNGKTVVGRTATLKEPVAHHRAA